MGKINQNRHRVIITGSSGALGYHILTQLLEVPGIEILALHRQKASDLLQANNVRHEVIDFKSRRQLSSLFRNFKPTTVIHCAAGGMIFPKIEWFNLIRFNVDFTLLLFEFAARQAGCHFIHISTGLAYRTTGLPLSETDAIDNSHPYGASKAAADILLRSAAIEFRMPLTVFRPFSFTGVKDSRTRLFPSLLRAATEGKIMKLSKGEQVRDFCSAHDIATAILLALDQPPAIQSPAIYNLGSGRSVTLRKLVTQIVGELKIPVELKFGLHPYTAFEPMHLVANIDRAKTKLKWKPKHNLAHAVWQLAETSFPSLNLQEPKKSL